MSDKIMRSLGRHKAVKTQIGTNIVTSGAQNKPLATGDYVIAIANSGNDVFVMACYDFVSGGSNNNWFDIPATGKNCNSDCDTCIKNKNYQPIINVNCSESRINLSIATKPDDQGFANVWTFDVAISCDDPGGVLCVN